MSNTLNNTGAWKGFSNSTWHWKWWAFCLQWTFFLKSSCHTAKKGAKTSIQTHSLYVMIELHPVVQSGQIHLRTSQLLMEQFLVETVRRQAILYHHKHGEQTDEEKKKNLGWLWKIRHSIARFDTSLQMAIIRNLDLEMCLNMKIATPFLLFWFN